MSGYGEKRKKGKSYKRAVGRLAELKKSQKALGKKWLGEEMKKAMEKAMEKVGKDVEKKWLKTILYAYSLDIREMNDINRKPCVV